MTQQEANEFLGGLEAAFDLKIPARRREVYEAALLKLDADLAHEAFNRIVWRSKRFPLVAEIVEAFEAARGPETAEATRSRPMGAKSQQLLERSVRDYLQLEPLLRDRDLYAKYLEALTQRNHGQITREKLREIRSRLIMQAQEKGGTEGAKDPDAARAS